MDRVKFSDVILETAQTVTDDCMGLEQAFCVAECPMNTDAIGYVNLIAEEKNEEAIDLIREKLFLPNTLGRICAHPCEENCRRNTEYNQPISIAALKRYAAEKADDEKKWDLSVKDNTGKKVVIVGAGPAGAQSAIDLRREGHAVTIIEKLNVLGGMMRVGIPEYRLPRNIIDFEYSYLTKLGIEIKLGVEVGADVSFEDLRNDYDIVILAHGAHIGSIIPIPGHKSKGVVSAQEYLKEISLTRKSTIAGKRIAVIGGGDVAMDCARSSWRVGAETVYQCSLENMDNLPASKEEIEESHEEGVIFNAGYGPLEIIEENGKVKGLLIQKVASIFDAEGNFDPEYEGEKITLEVDTVVFATGQLVEDITKGSLHRGRVGRYTVDGKTLETSIEGVFVAGDAAGTNIVIEAMAHGRKAALSIKNLLNAKPLDYGRDFEKEGSYKTKLDIPLPEGVENLPRLSGNFREPEIRKRDFLECDTGFTDEQALKEASRCLECECKFCMQECVMMNDFGDCPKDILDKLVINGEMDPMLAYSCNGCDNCTIVCPKELPLKNIFVGSRKDFVAANNGKSPMPGHKAINMHQLLGFSWLFTTKRKKGGRK
ncbi:MAG: FAD-dependent oxidoreductase [Alkaliphilus sp.]